MAILYKSTTGITGVPRTDFLGCDVAAEVDGVIVAITDAGACWRYQDGSWSEVNADITGAGGEAFLLYVDSRSNFYTSFNDGIIWRSTDYGATWANVHTFTNTPGYCSGFAEDKNGNLIVGNYFTGGTQPGAELVRSVDGGATWSSIEGNLVGGSGAFNRHIHNCFYDRYRDAVIVAGGDGGESVQVSFDFGDTFAVLTNTEQVTGMESDGRYFYYSADTVTDRSTYRLDVGNSRDASEWIAADKVEVFDPQSVPEATSLTLQTWQLYNFDGIIVAPYNTGAEVAFVAASENQGASWDILEKIVSANVRIGYKSTKPSFYANNGGLIYSHTSQNFVELENLYQWAVYPSSGYVDVDPSASSDNVAIPLGKLPEDISTQGNRFLLKSNHLDNVINTAPSVTIAKCTYTLGTDVTGTLAVDEDFEGASSLTAQVQPASSVVVDQASTAQAESGTRSAEIDLTAATTGSPWGHVEATSAISTSSGDTIWASGDFYIDNSTWDANAAFRTLFFEDYSSVVIAQVGLHTTGEWLLNYRLNGTNRDARQRIKSPLLATLQGWQKIKMGMYIHPTDGWIRVYVDDLLVTEIIGIQTLYDTGINQVSYGIQSPNKYRYYWDNCKAGIGFDSEQPPAVILDETSRITQACSSDSTGSGIMQPIMVEDLLGNKLA